jgi:hypothetical protein
LRSPRATATCHLAGSRPRGPAPHQLKDVWST